MNLQTATGDEAATVDIAPVRAAFVRALPSVADVSWAPRVVAVNAIAVLAFIFLVGFPAEPFDEALEAWSDHRRRRAAAAPPRRRWVPSVPAIVASHPIVIVPLALVAGVVSAAAAPDADGDDTTVRMAIALSVATIVVIALLDLPGALHGWRRGTRLVAHPRAAGLLLAIVLAGVGHAAGFQPSYVYGLVAGLGLATVIPVDAGHAGRSALVGALLALSVALVAWLVWTPVDHAADRASAGGAVLAVDAVLAALVVAGLSTVVFGFLPVRFMPGLTVFRWSRWAWAATWGGAMFVTLMVLGDTASDEDFVDYQPAAARNTTAALFVAACVASLAFRRVVATTIDRRPPTPAADRARGM